MTLAFEDFRVGKRMALPDYTISEREMLDFARRYDPQPFHTDPEAAAESPFGGLIGSGWLTTAVLMRMQCDAFLSDSTCVGSPGVDEIRWLHPVRPGDTLSGFAEVIEVRPSRSKPDRGAVFCAVSVSNQHDDVVMTLKTRAIFLTRGLARAPGG